MYMVAGFVFLAAVCLFLWFYSLLFGSRIELSRRAVEVVGQRRSTIRDQELSEPIIKRILRPFLNMVIRLASRMLPSEKEATLAKKIIAAGRPGNHGPKEFIAIKLILAVSGAALLIMAEPFLNWDSSLWLTAAATASVAGWVVPDFYLRQKIMERRDDVQKTLPDVLDLITVSLEAGMGFDGALLKVVEKSRGPLALEFHIVLKECKMGKSRKDALRDMADRLGDDDFSSFAGSIIMADQLGIGIGNIMRLQSEQMRRKRRQRAEEKAMKAPVKMMIPMVACIFPTIFVVLLGPAAISLYKNIMT